MRVHNHKVAICEEINAIARKEHLVLITSPRSRDENILRPVLWRIIEMGTADVACSLVLGYDLGNTRHTSTRNDTC